MNVLLVTPLYISEWDSGHFVLRALCQAGHRVAVWDQRLDSAPPPGSFDCSLVLQGYGIDPATLPALPRPSILWHFELLGEQIELDVASRYDKAYFVAYNEAQKVPRAVWLPGTYEPAVHYRYPDIPLRWHTLYIGTANSEAKVEWIKALRPQGIIGNGWDSVGIRALPPAYSQRLALRASSAEIVIDIHRLDRGPNRKLFELAPCAFTLVNRVEGIDELLGSALADEVSFSSVGEAKEKIRYYLVNPDKRARIWEAEQTALKRYTYADRVAHLLEGV